MAVGEEELIKALENMVSSKVGKDIARNDILLFKAWLHSRNMTFKDFLLKPYKTRENMLRDFCNQNNVDFGILSFNIEIIKRELDEHFSSMHSKGHKNNAQLNKENKRDAQINK